MCALLYLVCAAHGDEVLPLSAGFDVAFEVACEEAGLGGMASQGKVRKVEISDFRDSSVQTLLRAVSAWASPSALCRVELEQSPLTLDLPTSVGLTSGRSIDAVAADLAHLAANLATISTDLSGGAIISLDLPAYASLYAPCP